MPFPTIAERRTPPDERRVKRLDGWKEIASYLSRGVRTVKRWETQWDLPIHRIPGGTHGRVYAVAFELDEWLTSRSAHKLDLDSTKEPESAAKQSLDNMAGQDGEAAEPYFSSTHEPVRRTVFAERRSILALCGALLLAALIFSFLYFHPFSLVGGLRLPFVLNSASSGPGNAAGADRLVAHEFCLRGRYEWNERKPDSLRRALDDFTQAILYDPQSAEAYVGLADTYLLQREYSNLPENEAYAQALVAARKAVAINDSSAEAHRALAFALTNGNWDFIQGEKEFRRSSQLNPSDPVAHRWFANAFAVPGRFPEALEEMNKAQELDPTSNATLADKGLLLYKAGKASEGIDLLKHVERANPAFRSPHFYLMNICFAERDYPAFLDEVGKTAQAENDAVLKDIAAAASAAYRRGGEKLLLQTVYAMQRKYYEEGKLLGMTLAKTCLAMGRRKEALVLLRQEYARHSPAFLWCLSDPDLLALRDEPEYQQVVSNIDLPWLRKKSMPDQIASPSSVRARNESP